MNYFFIISEISANFLHRISLKEISLSNPQSEQAQVKLGKKLDLNIFAK